MTNTNYSLITYLDGKKNHKTYIVIVLTKKLLDILCKKLAYILHKLRFFPISYIE